MSDVTTPRISMVTPEEKVEEEKAHLVDHLMKLNRNGRRHLKSVGEAVAKPFVAIDHKVGVMTEKTLDHVDQKMKESEHAFATFLKYLCIAEFVNIVWAFVAGAMIGALAALIAMVFGVGVIVVIHVLLAVYYTVGVWMTARFLVTYFRWLRKHPYDSSVGGFQLTRRPQPSKVVIVSVHGKEA